MRFSFASLALVALTAQTVVGDGWFGSAGRVAYNKWHETELERWLSDHNVPYPTPADRKNLEDLVKKNWEDNVVKPYKSWDTNQLQNYLQSAGKDIKKGTEKNKDSLVNQVQSSWHETAATANDAYGSVEKWIFDTWTESQLKSFLDYHDIPNPSPRTRDSLLHTARANYQKIADKAGEKAQYPGNWLWQGWSDSDLKAWLDERGVPAPQPSNRDKLIASLRRNARVASVHASSQHASATSSAAAAQSSISEQLLESWSDSQIKEWADKNGIKVPQGSKRNELLALARKHLASLSGDNVASSASAAYGSATTSAANFFAQNTDDLYKQFRHWYDYALNQVGFASAEAQKSLSSASSVASVEASKSSVLASKSASSAASEASKSASSAASAASKSAGKNADKAKASAASAKDKAKKEL